MMRVSDLRDLLNRVPHVTSGDMGQRRRRRMQSRLRTMAETIFGWVTILILLPGLIFLLELALTH